MTQDLDHAASVPVSPPPAPTAAELRAAVVESCEYAIYSEDLDGFVTTWNAGAHTLFGHTADEMIGASGATLLPADQQDAHRALLDRIRDGEALWHFETIRLHKDGSPILLALTISPIRDGAGRIVGCGTVARDISDRKQVEAELRRRSTYTRSLIEANLDPLVAISPTGKITDVNTATVAVTGVPREQLIGTDFSDYFTEPDRARAAYRQAFDGGPIRDYPLTIRSVDGRTTDVVYNATVYRDPDQKVAGVFAAARDVSALKRVQAELERSNAELEQFAYAASHDLAEPLRAISGPVALVARKYRGKLDPQADEFLDFAVDGCARMDRLIKDLLAYSRVGRLEDTPRLVDTGALVDQAIDALSAAIGDTGARITVGPLPAVTAEPTQLTLVFQNLLSNAIKFVAPDTTPVIDVNARLDGRWWRFAVTDNGIGIEDKQRVRVFGMFKRLHAREEYPGTGIGLALAKKIVERYGGAIGVEPGPGGVGSRFWFTLPADGDADADAETGRQAEGSVGA